MGGTNRAMKNKFINPELTVCIFDTEKISTDQGVPATSAVGYTAAQDVSNQLMQVLMRRGGGAITAVKMENIMSFK